MSAVSQSMGDLSDLHLCICLPTVGCSCSDSSGNNRAMLFQLPPSGILRRLENFNFPYPPPPPQVWETKLSWHCDWIGWQLMLPVPFTNHYPRMQCRNFV